MKWFRSLSTIAKIGVGGGLILLLCITCSVFVFLLPDSPKQQELTQEDLVASAMAEIRQAAGESTEVPGVSSPTEAPTETQVPSPTENPNLVSPGTHLVGSDIEPGIYMGEAGADLFDSCYWARLNSLSGEFDAIIANDNSIGQFYIEVKITDTALEVNCQIELLEEILQDQSGASDILSPGTYLVGPDIQPGTYRGQAGEDFSDSCYWERLHDVGGEFSAIIANDNAIGQFFVQVSPTDFALTTNCELVRVSD